MIGRYYAPLDWFFRIHGWGLTVQPLKGHYPLFMERHGLRRRYHVFGLCVGVLRPWPR